MADRYWVGGTGTWNTTSTTNWSASSGGASGASVPTSADSIFFDQAGTYTVTLFGGLACLNFTVSAGVVTFAGGGGASMTISGGLSWAVGTVSAFGGISGALNFNSGGTVTLSTNGVGIGGNPTQITGGTKNLGSAFPTGNITFQSSAVLNTNGYTLTTSGLFVSGTATLNLGSSTLNFTGGNGAVLINQNITLNAGTSQINVINAGAGLISISVANNYVFYNVAFTSTASNSSANTITNSNTFNNISVTAPSTAGTTTLNFGGPQVINGTLSTVGTAGNRRVFFGSTSYGISQTLTINSAPSLTDADFRNIYVLGTSAPIGGTRIGNRGECRNITFDAPKTVYWNAATGGAFPDNAWALSAGGAVSTDNFPLPQDTATFVNTGLNASATVSLNNNVPFLPGVNFSGRTTAMTFSFNNVSRACYGNWTSGSGVTYSGGGTLTFQGGGTQTLTSAGKTFTCSITVDTYGGTVQLADALNIGSNNLTVTNGTFTTAGFAVTAGVFSSANSNIRTINLGASTLTLSSSGGILNFATSTNLTFNAGTSQINLTNTVATILGGSGVTFYNVSCTTTTATTHVVSSGINTFNNLSVTAPSTGITSLSFVANQTINGTLTCAGATAVRRIFLTSSTIGTRRTLTVNSISATDCDFRDINLAGAAAGSSPTRAGDCGGNTGITFPAAKTVYWNLAGTQNWSATGWCPSSGGTPDINQFPLAQDTAVFDNTGAAGTVTINAGWNIGTFDASLRTSAMTLGFSAPITVAVYGDWKFGTGVTANSTASVISFCKDGTQTITSNGVQFNCILAVSRPSAYAQLADALSLNSTSFLRFGTGTFDAVTYNVTAGGVDNTTTPATPTIKMGSGTWTLTGTGAVWNFANAPSALIAGTATIVLSNTTATARTFNGGGLYYNKLTIGGTTGTATLTISGANTFGEIASTKTVAHTITLPSSTTTTVGKWSVTGTVGNVVTLAPSTAVTAYTLSIAGPANTGIDYLSISYCTVATTSPGEFYVGVNSTNTAGNTRVIFTATPAARTLYWVGGTGNWSDTARWSTSSGGGSGAAIPTSLDAVNFDSASNATAYTATIDAGVTLARCASFTMAGPAAGNVTFAGTVGIAFHGNVSFAATGITRTYTGAMNWAGNSSYTFTTNGLTLNSNCTVIGIGATWTLGSALTTSATSITVAYGTFTTNNFALTVTQFLANITGIRTVNLGSSTVTIFSATIPPTNTAVLTPAANLTFNAGTSQITLSNNSSGINSAGITFYNVSFTNTASSNIIITGANTFNNLNITGRTTVGISPISFNANQTINGTLTVSAGTASAFRNFIVSDTFGTTRTLTCAAVSLTDVDFQDITIAGAAAPASGTRLGDAKGNSGITFPAAKTVYWAVNTANWGATGAGSWAATSGGSAAADQFPLPQDTAYIPFATPTSGSTITVNANYNIGTIEMSNRNGSALVTLATGSTTPTIYGNWINGTGTTLSGTSNMTFAGRGSQTITSAGRSFSQNLQFNTPGGSITLQDAFTTTNNTTNANTLTAGTFDANGYNVTTAATINGNCGFGTSGSLSKVIAIGAGTWTIGCGNNAWNNAGTNVTVTGTGTISLTGTTTKSFVGGGISYSGITLNNGGALTLTITGNNTFKTITNTYSATGATSISLGGTTTTLTDPWTATGAAGRVLTITGSPANLVYTGAGVAANSVDYLSISNVRAYPLVDEWYAGANSTNGGSLGWYFVAAGGTVYAATITETGTGSDSILARAIFNSIISETGTGTDSISASLGGITYLGTIEELATGSDAVLARAIFRASLAESGTGTDTISARSAFGTAILESATIADTNLARLIARATLSETATGSDTESASLTARSTLSESATITDANVGRISFPTVISETASGSDTDAASLTVNPAISETATGTDAVSARAIFLAAVAESSTITDLISAIKGYFVAILESATGTDTFSAKYTTLPSVSETAAITDANVGFISFPTTISETATGTDTDSAQYITRPSIAESATGTETVSTLYSTNPSVAESATGTETVSPRYIANPSIVESASITDAVAARYIALPSIFESASGSDIIVGGLRFIGVIAESATGTETVAARYITNPFIAETATGSDTDAARLSAAGIISETATGTEAITARATFKSDISEYSSVVEIVRAFFTAAAQVSELATGTDQVSALRALAAAVAETATITDSLFARAVFIGRLQEAATAQDAVNAPGSTYNILMQELAEARDRAIAQAIFPVSLTETATGTETNSAAFIPRATITESATITDAVSALQAFAARILETSAASDSVLVAPSIFNAIAVASATALDNLNAPGSIYNVTVPESATLSDSVIGAYLWNLIDDSQPESWQNVLDAQSVTWSAINASQTAGWGEVDSAQATSWGNADSAQAPGWQDVQTSQTGTWNSVDDSQSVNWQNVVDTQSVSWNDINASQNAGWGNTGNAQSGTWNNIDDDQDPDWVDIPTLN